MRLLRAVSVTLIALASGASAQTVLTPGDVAIVGLWSDDLSGTGGGTKTFAVVNLVDLEPGTVVQFSDNGWQASGVFRLGEGVTTLTVGPGGLQAGSVTTLPGVSGSFNLSTAGDQIFAFQGAVDGGTGAFTGILLWGVNDEGTPGAWQANAVDANTSALPPALASFSIALDERDNYAYTGPPAGTIDELRTELRSPANWTGSDTVQLPFPAGFSISIPAPVPALGSVGRALLGTLLATGLLVARRRRLSS